jgi:hypothetical protein
MPDYVLTHYYRDINGGETLKQYEGTFTDYATARTAADNFTTDAQNLTDGYLYRETLAETQDIAGAAAATSNVFERISATMDLGAGKRANLQVPSPVAGAFVGNSLDTGAAVWTDYEANINTGGWTISDGESVSGTISGKRIYVRSGRTNLPT